MLISKPEGKSVYNDADMRAPEKILNHPVTQETLDFTKPIALMVVSVLHFFTDDAQVTRIVLEGDRTSGIELKAGQKLERISCSGDVILCAGAFNTPALLQHSGIGPAEHLRAIGIEPLVDLPAVGNHLMEHPIAYTNYELAGKRQGLFDAEDPKHLIKWLLRRRGKLTSNIGETDAHIRTDPAMPGPNFQLLFSPAYFMEHGLQSWDAPAASIVASFIAPESRGSVRVRSADPLRRFTLATAQKPDWRSGSRLDCSAPIARRRERGLYLTGADPWGRRPAPRGARPRRGGPLHAHGPHPGPMGGLRSSPCCPERRLRPIWLMTFSAEARRLPCWPRRSDGFPACLCCRPRVEAPC